MNPITGSDTCKPIPLMIIEGASPAVHGALFATVTHLCRLDGKSSWIAIEDNTPIDQIKIAWIEVDRERKQLRFHLVEPGQVPATG